MSVVSIIGGPQGSPEQVRILKVLGEAPARNHFDLSRTNANTPGHNPYAGLPLVSSFKTGNLDALEGQTFRVIEASMGRGTGWKHLRMLPEVNLAATLWYDVGNDPVLEHNNMQYFVKVQ
jgi:hypothetical protein